MGGGAVFCVHAHVHSIITLTIPSSSSKFNHKSSRRHFNETLTPKKTLTSISRTAAIIPTESNSSSYHHSTKHTTLLVDTFHHHRSLQSLLSNLTNPDSCPLRLLRDHGDWSKDEFWLVVNFLRQASRPTQLLQLFDLWKNIEKSRVNEFNYGKIIAVLSEEGLMEDAVSAFEDKKSHGLQSALGIYNLLIHGFATKANFTKALFYLDEMKDMGVARETDTYDGLIQAYGKYKMYDEMGMCVRNMESDGCSPDHITYNLLVEEFSKAGLLKRMEKMHQTMMSKRMDLRSSSLVAMLDAYAKFGILDKMEMVYRRVTNSKSHLTEDLVRKLAGVYIQNYMYSRLETLGIDLSLKEGKTNLVWCLRLLSHACLLSRQGMNSIVEKIDEAEIPWNITIVNIILLAYLKMKDFKRLRILLSEIPRRKVKPDLVSIGIVLDASRMGFDGAGVLEIWGKIGFLYKDVEMNTDSLVLAAFGKGSFLGDCEKAYSSLEPDARAKKIWTYYSLIDLVSKTQ